jgi:hypothetical protein
MKLELTFCGSLCSTDEFRINGQPADHREFGDSYDHSPETAEDYGCGDMRFERQPSTPELLARYSITETEYSEICDKLEEGLSFGRCGWCV